MPPPSFVRPARRASRGSQPHPCTVPRARFRGPKPLALTPPCTRFRADPEPLLLAALRVAH
jgi:hypothetical protein